MGNKLLIFHSLTAKMTDIWRLVRSHFASQHFLREPMPARLSSKESREKHFAATRSVKFARAETLALDEI